MTFKVALEVFFFNLSFIQVEESTEVDLNNTNMYQ